MARKNIPRRLQAAVYLRDGFNCRYCGMDVVFSPALKALDASHPDRGYYDRHGRVDRMSKMLLDRCAAVDHVVPVDAGGENALANLVTACWACNLAKSNDTAASWTTKLSTRPRTTPGWDGMLAVLEALDPHNVWLALFDRVRGDKSVTARGGA
jgi:5-methylcytosine-specific restriction endonuclease McrA